MTPAQLESAITVSNGEHAITLIDRQVRALVAWHGPVLANNDREPLHQMRVSMRRLRVSLSQFAPLLQLPEDLRLSRLAKTARRLGLARDLDVLQARLEHQWLPQLPAAEIVALRSVLKQLRRERLQAHGQVVDQLKGAAYLRWLAQMQQWLRQPALTPLAEEPLAAWLVQWQLGWLSPLCVHPGWHLQALRKESHREQLHDLRKQIKTARYQLDNCRPLLGEPSRTWQNTFKQMQDLLGELNDLQVLQRALDDQLPASLAKETPALARLLQHSERDCWQAWRALAAGPMAPATGQRLLESLQADQRRALRRQQWHALCSGIQRSVAFGLLHHRSAR